MSSKAIFALSVGSSRRRLVELEPPDEPAASPDDDEPAASPEDDDLDLERPLRDGAEAGAAAAGAAAAGAAAASRARTAAI